MLYVHGKQLRPCWDGTKHKALLKHIKIELDSKIEAVELRLSENIISNSVLSRIREFQPSVYNLGCICQLAHTCIQYRLKKLSLPVEELLINMFVDFFSNGLRLSPTSWAMMRLRGPVEFSGVLPFFKTQRWNWCTGSSSTSWDH